MKNRTKVVGLLSVVCLSLAANVNAEDCTWSLTGLNVNPNKFIFSCNDNGTLAATKTVTVPVKGATQCSIVVDAEYSNTGSCNSPNIVAQPDEPYFPITITNTTDNSPYCTSSYTSPSDPTIWRSWTISCPNTSSVKIDLITPPGAGVCYPQMKTSGYSVSGHCSGFTVSEL